MRNKIAQRLRRLVATVGLTLALTVFFISSVFASEDVTLPIGTGTCGLVVANVFPSFDGAQPVQQSTTGAKNLGVILAKGNDMNVDANGQAMTKETSENGRFWTTPISGTNAITVSTDSGPDKPWATIASASGLRRLVVSLGNSSLDDNVYEKVVLQYTAYSDKVTGCVIGAFNVVGDDLPITVIVRVNGVEDVTQRKKIEASKIAGVLDLISFETPTKVGDTIEVEVTNTESPNQDRADYFLAGIVVRGASQSGQAPDNDNDGVPDDEDQAPGVRDCNVTVGTSVGPYIINQLLDIDVSATGLNCGGVVTLKHMGGNLIKVLQSDGTYIVQPGDDFEGDCRLWYGTLTTCALDQGHNHFRLTIQPLRAGRNYGYANIGFVPESFRYWSGFWDVAGTNLFVSWTAR
jgi:hypothetical protein